MKTLSEIVYIRGSSFAMTLLTICLTESFLWDISFGILVLDKKMQDTRCQDNKGGQYENFLQKRNFKNDLYRSRHCVVDFCRSDAFVIDGSWRGAGDVSGAKGVL